MIEKQEHKKYSFKYPLESPHTRSKEVVCAELSSDVEKGLDGKDANERLIAFGPNVIIEKKAQNPFLIFLAQLKGPFVILLFIAAGLSFWFKEWLDGIAILIVILINTVIGFLMEYKAERSMEALKRLTKVTSKIIRNGKLVEISTDNIVPGDLLFAEAGDIIPADARIIQYSQLQVDESALTGESVAVEKQSEVVPGEAILAERINMLYKGTAVTKGNVRAIVTGTGMQTELGSIAAMVQSAKQTATPLELKIQRFTKKILWLTITLVVIIFIAGLIDGDKIVDILQIAIVLAVAAIPEGLPIVTTLALAQGMLRMAKQNVIIKKLSAVETLGETSIICTDKTGTLTQNKIEVNTIVVPGGRVEIKQNHIQRKTEYVSGDKGITENRNYQLVQKIVLLCNTAEISVEHIGLKEIGDPLEAGLLKFVYSHGLEIVVFREENPKIKEEPFASETKIMATLHKSGENNFVAAKGAVEEILKRCTNVLEKGNVSGMNDTHKKYWLDESEKMAKDGLKVIATAYKEINEIPDQLSSGLVFAGLIGMLDLPAEGVIQSIKECKSAGIKVIMITGDHPATAKNIGMKIGLLDSDKEEVILGKDMPEYEKLSDTDKNRWLNTKIFARVSPKQKLDLVLVLQEKNAIVGMTGDGVNDAPALKEADIGIAMGQRGTQVAQESADMILEDDSFSSIVVAIKQGRVIFENIRKFIIYLLSCNLSELLVISISALADFHFALLPLQILYINLLTDVFPALALGVTKGSDLIMKQAPRKTDELLIDRKRWISIFTYSFVIAACCLGAVLVTHFMQHTNEEWNPELCNNVLFLTLIFCQLWHVFNMTTENSISIFKTDVFKNKFVWFATVFCLLMTLAAYAIPPVAKVLSLYRPSNIDFAIMSGFSLFSFFIIRILKRLKIIL